MDWPTVFSQAHTTIAAALGGIVVGVFGLLTQMDNRKHEIQLLKYNNDLDAKNLAEERTRTYIQEQRNAVKTFLHAVRAQQATVAEEQGRLMEEMHRLEAAQSKDTEHIYTRIDSLGAVARGKLLEAWEELDGNLTDPKLRSASRKIGIALEGTGEYYDGDLFPELRSPSSNPSPDFTTLLFGLRNESASIIAPAVQTIDLPLESHVDAEPQASWLSFLRRRRQ